MKKFVSIAILAVSVALTGCSTIAPKTHEGKGYSKAKEIMVGLGVPQQYITDGDTPQTAKFEGQTWTDGVTKHAGLATAVATLSITNTFMATMGSSDYEKQVAWKSALTQPMVFAKIDNYSGMFNTGSIEYENMFLKDYMLSNGYVLDGKGFYHKNGKRYLTSADFSEPITENGVKKHYLSLYYNEFQGQKNIKEEINVFLKIIIIKKVVNLVFTNIHQLKTVSQLMLNIMVLNTILSKDNKPTLIKPLLRLNFYPNSTFHS